MSTCAQCQLPTRKVIIKTTERSTGTVIWICLKLLQEYYKDFYCILCKTRIAFVNFAGNEQNKIFKSKLYLQEKIAMRWWFFVWQLVTLSAPEASAHIQDGTLALEKRHSKGLALTWNLQTQTFTVQCFHVKNFTKKAKRECIEYGSEKHNFYIRAFIHQFSLKPCKHSVLTNKRKQKILLEGGGE